MESVVQGSFQAPNGVEHQFDMEEGSVEMAPAGATITPVDEHVTPTPETNFGALFKEEMKPCRKKPKEYSKWGIAVLAYQTLGVVYGDLGTSPLYVYPTIQIDSPQEEDFLGILSLIFWTLTMIGLVKYVFIVLQANDHGDGGTFAIYSLLCQHANIGQNAGEKLQKHESDVLLSFHGRSQQSRTKRFLESSVFWQKVLLFVVLLGTSMVIGDGVLTPAISVLSAVVGIRSAQPSFDQSKVVWVSLVILVGLFLLQRFGTSKVAFIFSPIMVAWFLTTPTIGVYNIVKYHPTVLKAVSPHYIVIFFQRNKVNGWKMLEGAVLAITGAEAMFCDLSHFNKSSIQLAFSSFVYPSLILTYAGQTAYLIKNPGDISDAFYKSIPHAVYWPMFVVATLAAIVASQALISATFTIVKQSMALGCFPRVQIRHTSKDEEGQVYSPEINYLLMILCIAVVAGFKDGTQIGNAFGVAVIWVMLITTVLMTLVELIIWRLPWPIVLVFFTVFGTIEGVYMTAVLNKVPQGGWVPFAIAAVFLVIMSSWNYGHQRKIHYEMNNKMSVHSLQDLISNSEVQRVKGICFFYSDLVHGVPPIIPHYIRNVQTLHQILIFSTIRYLPIRTVLPEERFLVGRVGFKGAYRCVARYGYMDVINLKGNEFKDQVLQQLQAYLQSEDQNNLSFVQRSSVRLVNESGRVNHNGVPNQAQLNLEDIHDLNLAAQHESVHVLGRTMLECGPSTGYLDRIVVNKIYRFLKMICRPAVQALRIPSANFLEVGIYYEL
ncbi:unnamed protein product [Sphagnum jensenii]|uniref:Potassium transporter n=2 Tax=Sphagnum jensenii TaxID=128206 RepID=A0ABP0X660_9BRYO